MLFTNDDSLIPVVKSMTKRASQTIRSPGATSSGDVSDVPPTHLIVLGEKCQNVDLPRNLFCMFLKKARIPQYEQTPAYRCLKEG